MCYLHQFYEQQPDLNLRNADVKEELKDIMKFWLDLGVDGFRVDSVAHFFEGKLKNSVCAKIYCHGFNTSDINHSYRFYQIDPEFKNEQVKMDKTYNQPEVLNLLQEFRAVLDEKTAEDTYNPRYTNKNSIDISI